MNIFISYAREDKDMAEKIYQSLSVIPDISPWLDTKKLLPGVRWKHEIMKVINDCDLFILLLSKNSITKKGFVQNEIYEALNLIKSFPPDKIFVIPARLEKCFPKHGELRDLQWIDLFPDWESGMNKIYKVIEHHLGKRIKLSIKPDITKSNNIITIRTQNEFNELVKEKYNLNGIDAMEVEFDNLNLVDLNLSGSNFIHSTFNSCKFNNTKLSYSNLECAEFINCYFENTSIDFVNLWGAIFRDINLFTNILISNTNIYQCTLTDLQKKFFTSENTISISDYSEFVDYFIGNKMTIEEFSQNFIWINHPYFLLMFGEFEKYWS